MVFSPEEYADIVFVYGFCDGNARAAEREYARRFPRRIHPGRGVFPETYQRLRETGSTAVRGEGRGRPGLMDNVDVVGQVLEEFNDDPTTSVRRVAARTGVPPTTVHAIVRADGRHPYHYTRVQGLDPGDPPRRLTFCQWLLTMLQFLGLILWTDEATFTRAGVFNQHNAHYWAAENPHVVHEDSFQREFSLNVWIGVIGDRLVGPFFLPHRLNGQGFLDFLNGTLLPALQDLPDEVRQNMWYQMDGAPVHWARIVRAWMNEHFPERWIGRDGHVGWPPRSPALTPLDFFVWGYLKSIVYSSLVNDVEELRQRIIDACAQITPEMIHEATAAVQRRCEECIAAHGGVFEQNL